MTCDLSSPYMTSFVLLSISSVVRVFYTASTCSGYGASLVARMGSGRRCTYCSDACKQAAYREWRKRHAFILRNAMRINLAAPRLPPLINFCLVVPFRLILV